MCALSLSGCVIPPHLDEAPPADNEPPVILRDDEGIAPAAPGEPVSVCGNVDVGVRIVVTDDNLTDALYLRLFLDDVTGPEQVAPPDDQLTRVFNPSVIRPCQSSATGDSRLLEAVISDRAFEEETGRQTPAAARTATIAWVLRCLAIEDCSPTPTDGGL